MLELFVAERRRLSKIIDNLVAQNDELVELPKEGFIYNGTRYYMQGCSTNSRVLFSLDRSLIPSMREYLADESFINNDEKIISQVLFTAIVNCQNDQELRDSLPDSLVSLFPSTGILPRMVQTPGYLLMDNERGYRQFLKVVDKIDFYCATRLLY